MKAISIYTSDPNVEIERFHICTWDLRKENSLVEIGAEINLLHTSNNDFDIILSFPWKLETNKIEDLYDSLNDFLNVQFIFNETVIGSNQLDGQGLGIIHEFGDTRKLCFLPVSFKIIDKNLLSITCQLNDYQKKNRTENIYFRIKLLLSSIQFSERINGNSKTMILYDYRINEKRNLPRNIGSIIKNYELAKIKTCFCLHIIPSSWDISFLDSNSLKNMRTIEYASFSKYLSIPKSKLKQLDVVFQKRKKDDGFTFFSKFNEERVGTNQIVIGLLLNLLCGAFLAFIPFASANSNSIVTLEEGLVAYSLLTISLGFLYFLPSIRNFVSRNWSRLLKK